VKEVLAATLALCAKELRVELRTGEIVVTTALFATLIAVLTSLAFYVDRKTALQVAPGVLWIAVTFAGVLAMGRSFQREREHEVYRALLLSPVPRSAIYVSKVVTSFLFLVIVETLVVLEVTVLFNLDLGRVVVPLVGLLLLGTLGFTATGNLFAALSLRTRAREMMLAVTLLPVVAPALLAGVVATRELLAGVPVPELAGWFQLLLAFDLVALAGGIALFDPLMDD
jgi:heme exporter protein B